MVRVLLATVDRVYPVSNGGAVRVMETARFLAGRGLDVHVLAYPMTSGARKKAEAMTGANIHCYSFPTYAVTGVLHKLGLFRLAWVDNALIGRDIMKVCRRVRPDVVQAEFLHIARQAYLVGRKLDIPVVLDEHNVESVKLPVEGVGRRESLEPLERDICNSMDAVVVVSEHDRQILLGMGVANDIALIPNGVSPEKYDAGRPARAEMRKRFGFEKDDIVLIFHGTALYRPNAEASALLRERIYPELSQRCSRVKLLMLGPGRQTSVSSNIVELAEVPYEELPDYLGMADIGVVPLTSGSGTRLKIIEYLAQGLPVVSTAVGAEGLPVTDGSNILIAGDTGAGLIDKVATLINDQAMRDRIGRNGRRLAEEKLSWSAVLEEYLKVYDRVLKGKGYDDRSG